MAAKGGRIDFMFLAPPPYPAAGSATDNLFWLFSFFEQIRKNVLKSATKQTKSEICFPNFVSCRFYVRTLLNASLQSLISHNLKNIHTALVQLPRIFLKETMST